MQQRVLAAAHRVGRAVITSPPPAYAIFPPQTLRPGASLGVGLSSGDIGVSAIGTVTYTDGPNVWGFGHPLDAFGARSLLLQDAYVYDVINNPVGSEGLTTYKYAAPGHNLGTLSNDTISAVVGKVGELPPLIQMATHIRDLDTGSSKDTNVQITDERSLDLPPSLDLIAPIAIGDGAFNVLGSAPFEQSGTLCMSIKIRERQAPLRFCNRYTGAAVDRMIDDASRAIVLVDSFPVRKFHQLHVERVDAVEGVARGRHQGVIVGASGAGARPARSADHRAGAAAAPAWAAPDAHGASARAEVAHAGAGEDDRRRHPGRRRAERSDRRGARDSALRDVIRRAERRSRSWPRRWPRSTASTA